MDAASAGQHPNPIFARRNRAPRPKNEASCPNSARIIVYEHLSSYSGGMARRRPGTLFPLEVDILESGLQLQASVGSFYGFALARQLAERDGAALTAHGTLYKALARMTESGLLESSWEDPATAEADGRPRRRLYTVTGEGALALVRAQTQAQTQARTIVEAPVAKPVSVANTVSPLASAQPRVNLV
jgi:PadR family transcriptional regulator PadR